jgi:transcriptional regulator with XRE-family HTH domain
MIKLNVRNIRLIQAEREITDCELARMIGVSQSAMRMILRNELRFGANFIAFTLKAFPELRFEDLFIVE